MDRFGNRDTTICFFPPARRLTRLAATLILILSGVSLAPATGAEEWNSPDPRWSLTYLLEGSRAIEQPTDVITHHSTLRAPAIPPQDSPDVAVQPGTNVTQTENSTFVDPNDNDIVFVSTNATDWPVTQVYGTGVYWSLDGGATWAGNDFGPGGIGNKGDPAAVIRGIDGRWVVGYINPGFGQGVSYTDNQGASWSHVSIFPGGTLDKNHLMADNVPTSAHYGNLYSAWSNLGGGTNNNDIEFVRSTDGGVTWSATAANISNNVFSGSHDQGINIQVGPNGEVYTTWAIYDSWPSDETAIGFNRSLDGGVTWTGEFRAITGIRGHRNTSLPNTSIRRSSFPSMTVDVSGGANDGAIYIVWTNIGVPGVNTGDPDIYMAKSTDGGVSFGTPTRVNQDATTNAQWFPWIACDPITGNLTVVFYDRRDDLTDTIARTYMAVSSDGGATWDDFAVGDVSFTPIPIPGLAGGYMGDYLGMAVSNGKAYPTWSDNRSGNFLCYISPILLSPPNQPNPPTDVTAFSDYLTPTSAWLDWTDATTFADGSPLVDFSVDILRDGLFVTNVDQGIQTYSDPGLADGQQYTYTLHTHDDITDSLSTGINVSVYAGGSPIPEAPTTPGCVGGVTTASISWTNPSTQNDGTTLDDFAGVRIYRNGTFLIELARLSTDGGNADSYIDSPPPDFVYMYEIAAIDDEIPVNESSRTPAVSCFVGDTPALLVWQPADALSISGDSLFAELTTLGESVFLTDDLFFFGPDLNAHEIVFSCVGVTPNNHIVSAIEGAALDTFVANGGGLYLEGGNCFNYDPEITGGYNFRPMFGLSDGPTGTADLLGLDGLNDFAQFQFTYTGQNNQIDELQPGATTSPIFENNVNGDVVTVVKPDYGLGRSIGATYEFGGLITPGIPVADQVGKSGPTGKIAANTKADLLSAYLALFRSNGDPVMSVSTGVMQDTLLQDFTSFQLLTISNPGSVNDWLSFTITENPAASWLTVTPTSSSVLPNGIRTVQIDFDATGLLPGLFTTELVIAGNDPANPFDTVAVTLTVLGKPGIAVDPDTLVFSMLPDETVLSSLTISNTGLGDLTYDLVMIGTGGVEREAFNDVALSQGLNSAYRGNVYEIDIGVALRQIDQYLSIPVPSDLEFFIYENSLATGTFTKVLSKTITSGTGEGWYSTGRIDFVLDPAKSYFIGCGVNGSATFFRDDGENLPQTTAFGTLKHPGGTAGYPPPPTTLINNNGSAIWAQAMDYGVPLDVSIQSVMAGTILPGQSTVVDIEVTSQLDIDQSTAVLNITHNDPLLGKIIVPIPINVVDPTEVAAANDFRPPSIALHAPAPNPFRGATVIRYDLPIRADVRITVFDVAGRLVRTTARSYARRSSGGRGLPIDFMGRPKWERPERRAGNLLLFIGDGRRSTSQEDGAAQVGLCFSCPGENEGRRNRSASSRGRG